MDTVLGRYRIRSFQQRTDVNSTAIAEDTMGGEVVIRAVREEAIGKSWPLRMEHEVKRLRQLECPHFNHPLDFGRDQGWVYIAYQYVVGTPLTHLIERAHRSDATLNPIHLLLDAAKGCLTAVGSIHSADLVHRDVRSSHIVRQNSGRFILGGYGPLCVAQAFGNHGKQALEFASFASPELSGSLEHDVTPASDLYSIGIVLFHILMGRPPFEGDDIGEVLFQHLTSTPSYQGLDIHTPDVLVEFINRLIEKDVRDRYQNSSSALADLHELRKAILHGGDLSHVTIGCHDTRTELTEPSFVGREREMDSIKKEIAEVASGNHRTMIAIGKSGMGKSRLLLEAIRVAARRGFSVYRSVASDQATQEPLGPLLTIVDQLAKRLTYSALEVTKCSGLLEEYRAEIATAMPSLAKVLHWQSRALSGPEELGQGRIVAAFCEVLRVCAHRGPSLICIDDCQWLDKSSLRVLQDFVASQPYNIMLLIGSRPNERMSEEVVRALAGAHELRFGELDTQGIHVLAESMAGRLPREIKESVAGMSQGSPFLATAAMRGLVETGTLIPSNQGWKVDNERLLDFQAAGDSANILLKRLEYVDSETADLLAVGAVIGKQFDLQVPVSLVKIDIESAFAKFAKVREQGLVWSRPDGKIAFVHDKIREAVVSRIPDSQRLGLHSKIARYLEEHAPDRYFDLAYHYDAASLPELAWPHALKAAEEARHRYALDTAESQYRIASRVLSHPTSGSATAVRSASVDGSARADSSAKTVRHPSCLDPTSRHTIEVGMADTLLLLGRYEEAEEWFSKALLSAPDSLAVAKIRLKQGDLAFKKGDKGEALQRFEQALRDAGQKVPRSFVGLMGLLTREMLVQTVHSMIPKWTICRRENPSETERLTWKLYSKLAHCYWYVRDKYYTLWAHLRELNLAERYTPTLELAQAYSEHAPVMSLIPWQSRGLDYARRSLQIRKEAHDMWGQGQSRNFLSIMFYSGARYDECMNQAQQAVSVLERTGDFWEIHMAQYQHAASLYRMGRLKEAAEAAKALYESAVNLGDFQSSGNAVEIWVRASLGGVPDEAIATELNRQKQDHQASCQLNLAEGVQKHLAGDYQQAIAAFQKAVRAVQETGVINAYITPNYTWLVTSLRQLLEKYPPRTRRRRLALERQLRRASRRALRIGKRFQNELPHALRERALVYALDGQIGKAETMLNQSIQIAETQWAAYEIALSELELSRLKHEIEQTPSSTLRLQRAQEAVLEIEETVSLNSTTDSLSLMDRFEKLLTAGRKIVAAHCAEDVLAEVLSAAERLLRGDRVIVLRRLTDGKATNYEVVLPEDATDEFDKDLVRNSAQEFQAVLAQQERLERHGVVVHQSGAFLACPILVNDQAEYFLYVANTHLSSLFGEDECRLANYLASVAGGALERADGWERLESLNANLEQKIQERTEAVVERSKELEQTANTLRETQAKLEKAKTAAERASASKSDFLACMSHEIRTPMSAVLGFTEILRTRKVSEEERDRCLKRIHNNGEHLLALLNDLLDFSKIEADRLQVENIACDPYELVCDATAALESRAEEKGLSLEVSVENKIPQRITSDPTRIRQIVTNLVGNAIKFTSHGFVKVGLRLLTEVDAAPLLQIEVCDSGIGIDAEQLRSIFDPFTQADASTTRQFGGTGLGLSITKRLAEALGGGIEIESEVGAGSRFRVTMSTGDLANIPLVDKSEAEPRQSVRQEQQSVSLEGARILVADDVEANREIINYLLSEAGATVELVENGAEVLQRYEAGHQFDLVILDMQMPVKDGYTTAQELRSLAESPPIIALTANNLKDDEQRCLNAGCTAFLTKPIQFEKLLHTASHYCRNALSSQGSPSRNPKDLNTTRENALSLGQRKPDKVLADDDFQVHLDHFTKEFLVCLESKLDTLESLINDMDLPQLKAFAHEIKGTSGTFGLSEIAASMEHLEDAIENKISTEIVEHYLEFKRAYESSRAHYATK